MGRITVRTEITNLADESRSINCRPFVDTGLPSRGWKLARLIEGLIPGRIAVRDVGCVGAEWNDGDRA